MTRLPWEVTPDMFLSEAEVDRLLRSVRSRAAGRGNAADKSARLDQLILETLLFSGLRTSEFCGLSLGDAVLEPPRPFLQVDGPGRERRRVHIPRVLAELIGSFVREVRSDYLPEGVGADDPRQPLVFNERGRAYERTGLYRRVKRILTQAGLGERASIQLLRHTYGFLAYKRTGGNLLFVQRQLGHAHPMITSVYARLLEESYEDMADQVYGQVTPSLHAVKSID